MKNKRIISVILLLIFLMTTSLQAMAMESETVEVPFTVKNTPGTVVIAAEDGAPLPEETEIKDALEGSFNMTFSNPGTYVYKVYQKQNLDDYTAYYEKYDDTVYDVVVSVFSKDNGELYSDVTARIPGDSHKPDEIVFENESEKADLSIRKAQSKGEGEPTTELLEVEPGDKITYYVTVSNDTEGSVYDVNVTDEIPEGLQLVEGSISNEGSEADRVVSWNLGIMGPGESMTVRFTTTVPDVTSATTWNNIANGSFINQTGRVHISTEDQELSARNMSAGYLSAGVVNQEMRFAAEASEPQVIQLATNKVQAVYTPAETKPGNTSPDKKPGNTASTAKPAKPTSTVKPGNGSSQSRPKTGDNSPIALWSSLIAASFLCFIILIVARRRRKEEYEK